MQVDIDLAYTGSWTQAQERDRIVLTIVRFARDRWSGYETRDGVIPQHDRSVKVGGQVADPDSPRFRPDFPASHDECSVKTGDPADHEQAVVLQNAHQIGVLFTKTASVRAPAEDSRRTIQLGVSNKKIPVPVLPAEELAFSKLGEVGCQRCVQVRAANHFDPRVMRQKAAEASPLIRIGRARNIKTALLVK